MAKLKKTINYKNIEICISIFYTGWIKPYDDSREYVVRHYIHSKLYCDYCIDAKTIDEAFDLAKSDETKLEESILKYSKALDK